MRRHALYARQVWVTAHTVRVTASYVTAVRFGDGNAVITARRHAGTTAGSGMPPERSLDRSRLRIPLPADNYPVVRARRDCDDRLRVEATTDATWLFLIFSFIKDRPTHVSFHTCCAFDDNPNKVPEQIESRLVCTAPPPPFRVKVLTQSLRVCEWGRRCPRVDASYS